MPAPLSARLRAVRRLPLRRCRVCDGIILLAWVEKTDAALLDTCPCRPSGKRTVLPIPWKIVDQLRLAGE